MVPIHFCKFLIRPVCCHSVKGVREQVLTIKKKQLSSMNLKFHIDGEFQKHLWYKSIYLFIPTRLLPVIWDYNRCHSIIVLYYLLHTHFDLILITADQPGFEPRSPGPKAAMLPLCSAKGNVFFACDYFTKMCDSDAIQHV